MRPTFTQKLAFISLLTVFVAQYSFAQNGVGVNTLTPKSSFEDNGSFGKKVSSINSNTTLDETYGSVLCNTNAFTVTLPIATGCAFRVYEIKRAIGNTNTITIDVTSAGTIDGAASYVLSKAGQSITVFSDGLVWLLRDGSGEGDDWSLKGNAGTNPTTNFLGTTDAQDLVLRTNNTDKARLTSAGLFGVGFGNVAPKGGRLAVMSDGAGRDEQDNIAIYSNNGVDAAVAVINEGPSPILRFHVARGTEAAPFNVATNDEIFTIFGRVRYGAGLKEDLSAIRSYYKGDRTTALTNLQFYTSGGPDNPLTPADMTIDENGKVGIGTVSPEQNLTVFNGMNIDHGNTNNGSVTNSLRFGSTSGEAIGSKRSGGGTNPYGVDFYTNSVNRMVVTNGGYVGVGTTNPEARGKITMTTSNPTGGVDDDLALTSHGDNAQPGLIFYRSRGTEAAPTNVIAGDKLFNIDSYTYASGAYANTSSIYATKKGGSTDLLSDITFRTTSQACATFNENGRLGIGYISSIAAVAPLSLLHLYEQGAGSVGSATTGTIRLEHVNAGGSNSILFKSTQDGTDFGAISFSDNGSGNGSNSENSLLTIGVGNDASGTAGQDDIAIMSSGNVGIGTTTPSRGKLQMTTTGGNGGIDDDFAITSHGNSAEPAIIFYRSRGIEAVPTNVNAGDRLFDIMSYTYANGAYNVSSSVYAIKTGTPTDYNSNLTFRTSTLPCAAFNENGYLGVGKSSITAALDAQSLLHLKELGAGSVGTATTGTIRLEHVNAGGSNSILFKSTQDASDFGYISFSDDGSGNGSSAENSLLTIGVGNDVSGGPGVGDWEDDIALMPSGNVGINCTSPKYKLHVVGDVGVVGVLRATAASVTGGVLACSDIRYKKDVLQLNNSLANILKLKGVTYNWKVSEFPSKHFTVDKQIGFIAQDLEKVYPEVVNTDSEGYKSVDYSKMTPVLLEAIKELKNEVDALKNEIELLKKK